MNPLVGQLLGSVLSVSFDPQPIQFRMAHDRGVRPVRRACEAAGEQAHALKTPLNRNAFLGGCLDFTVEGAQPPAAVSYRCGMAKYHASADLPTQAL